MASDIGNVYMHKLGYTTASGSFSGRNKVFMERKLILT